MSLRNDAPAICAALEIIEPIKRITRGWPKDFEALPALAVSEVDNSTAEYRDDNPYIDQLIYDVRLFTSNSADKDDIAPLVVDAMKNIGYERIAPYYDDDTAEVRMKVMRFKRYAM